MPPRGQKTPEATKEKISKALKEGYASGRIVHSGATRTVSEETRQKMSEGLVRHFREEVAQRQGEPTHKRCCDCGRTKLVEEFPIRRNKKLKSGLISIAPYSYCKKCCCARTQAFRERLRAEGRLKESRERWEANQDQAHKARRRREAEWAKRREEGKSIREKLRKYPAEERPLQIRGGRVPTGPLNQFFKELVGNVGWPNYLSGADERRFTSVHRAESEYESISIGTADRLLTRLGHPEKLNELYPIEDLSSGYHVLGL